MGHATSDLRVRALLTGRAKLASRVASAVAARVAASLVARDLQRFVKKVGGEDISTLRVRLDGVSSLTLRDLDLNVDGALCLAGSPKQPADT